MLAMNDFTYYNPTKILFGRQQIEHIGNYIPADAKVLITYGGGSAKRFGTFDHVVAALGSREWGEFGGIEANPHYETLITAVEKIKAEQFDYIMAVGGGSVIDGTKFIAAAATFPSNPIDIFGAGIGKGEKIAAALPFGTVLTLPATSSEMNKNAVVNFERQKAKISFASDAVFPQFSVLEPEITYTLPQRQLSNGMADTFIHVLENYLTKPVGALIQDSWAEGLLRTIIAIAPQLTETNPDYNIRANYMWACTNGLNGILSPGLATDWATHQLGHEVTAFNNTDHARTLTPIMLATMKVRKNEKFEKIVQYAENVWGILAGSDEDKYNGALIKTEEFFKANDLPVTLADIAVKAEDIDYLIEQLEAHGKTALGENKMQTLEVSRQIYEASL